MTDLDNARVWAEQRAHSELVFEGAAARLIQSLPDQWVDVEKVREIVEPFMNSYEGNLRDAVQAIIDLITPKLPTLADMTQEEREACQWMQCEIDGQIAGILARVDEQRGHIWIDSGYSLGWKLENITPLPDLPKLQWPGDGVVDSEIVDEPETTDSSSIHTPMQPSEVPPNEPWLIEANGQKAIGTRYKVGATIPWSVAVLDGSFAGDYHDSEVTLIHKLVPEPPALPEGMRLADHKIYGRVVVSPGSDSNGFRAIFYLDKWLQSGVSYGYAKMDNLTFLDGEA